MRKIVITGAKGQLGQELIKCLTDSKYIIFQFGKDELDITNQSQVTTTIETICPDVIIHCAAYTDVDQSEILPEQAFEINAVGSRNIAIATEQVNASLVYISTNYVFDGESNHPYTEDDSPNPLGIYAKSKLLGETYVKELTTNYFIVRTSWLFGGSGKNFVTTMQEMAYKKESLSVIHDQIGNPTYAVDLAKQIIKLIDTNKYGVYHISNSGSCSWYEFAKEIFHLSNMDVQVLPITTEEYNALAPRPKRADMEQLSLKINGFNELRNWKEALNDYIVELKNHKEKIKQ